MTEPHIHDDIISAIGWTPLVRLSRFHEPANLVAKLEFMNPGGLIKERIAVAMVDKAERDGLLQPGVLQEAFSNPVALAFMVEAMLLMGAFAYLLTRWKVNRLHWAWFILLSMLGSMAFALPVVLLWPRGQATTNPGT